MRLIRRGCYDVGMDKSISCNALNNEYKIYKFNYVFRIYEVKVIGDD